MCRVFEQIITKVEGVPKTMNPMIESEPPPWATRSNLTSKKSCQSSRIKIPLTNILLVQFEEFCFSALSYLTNLRALEFLGRTLQVGNTIPSVESQPFSETATPTGVDIEEPEANNLDPVWRSVHRNTLENLLRVIVRYYRGLYLFPALQTLWMRLQEEDMDYLHYLHDIRHPTEKEDLPDDAVDTKNDSDYTPAALDIQALEQLVADTLVDFFYQDPEISCGVLGFENCARVLSDRYHTPVFKSSEAQFYTLVCNTFHNHPRRPEVTKYWDDSESD
jgi:hypothetical protein